MRPTATVGWEENVAAFRSRRPVSRESIEASARTSRPSATSAGDGCGATLVAIGCVGARQSISRRIPCSGRKGGIFPLLSRINSPVIPLLIPLLFLCYGRTSSPVRAEFIACPLGGERGFSAVCQPVRLRDASRRAPIGYAVAV